MRFHWLLTTLLSLSSPLISLPSTDAFTFGPYLPSYLCGPTIPLANGNLMGVPTAQFPNGTPKALAGVLAKFVEFTPAGEFMTNKQDSRLIVGAFHNANAAAQTNSFGGANDIQPAKNTTDPNILKGAIPITAQVFILQVGIVQALPAPIPATANTDALPAQEVIIPQANVTFTMGVNQQVLLSLQSRNNVPAQASTPPLSAAQFAQATNPAVLDGAIVFAQDANNNKVGKFTATGPNMALWDACGADAKGVVHDQLLSQNTNTYTGPKFFIPWWFPLMQQNPAAPATITFMGAAVTDNGFGYHQTKITVQPTTVQINVLQMAAKDVIACATNKAPMCFAACLDCALKAGSTPNKPAQGAKPTCTANTTIGNPAMGQETIWTAGCTINNVVTAVAPAAAIVTLPPQPKDATGNDVPMTSDQQNVMDQVNAALTLAANASATISQGTGTSTNNNNNGGTCPPPVYSMNGANAQSSSSTLFTTLAVVLGALFARQ